MPIIINGLSMSLLLADQVPFELPELARRWKKFCICFVHLRQSLIVIELSLQVGLFKARDVVLNFLSL